MHLDKFKTSFLVFGVMLLVGAGCSVTTANLQNVYMCPKMEDSQCLSDQTEFAKDTPELFVTALLQNALEGTTVNYSWYYLGANGDEEPYEIDTVEWVRKDNDAQEVYGSLSIPEKGWPVGKYKVVLKVVADNVEPITKEFLIK